MIDRRQFINSVAMSTAGLLVSTSAKSYARILGANDRLNFAIVGLNGRGYAHLSSLKASDHTARVSRICDVETNILKKFSDSAQRQLGYAPASVTDFRDLLHITEIDAFAIATPDHWHTPMA